MTKSFRIGDIVFAKVRGHPPWPARIDKISDCKKNARSPNKSKYHVFFYGTRETSVCKIDDLYDYEENKEKYGKPIKRRGFCEALSEVENLLRKATIKQSTTNKNDHKGNDGEKCIDEDLGAATKHNGKKGMKRKRENEFEHPDDKPANGSNSKIAKHTPIPVLKRVKRGSLSQKDTTVINPDKTINGSPSKPEIVSRSGRKIKPKKFADEYSEPSSSTDGDTGQTSTIDANKTLQLHRQSMPSTSTGFQRRARLSVKTPAALNNSVLAKCAPQEDETIEERNGGMFDENRIKHAKLTWFRIESSMLETENKLRKCLGINKADTTEGVNLLNHLSNLSIEPLMLKKHPNIVYTIRKLRRYVGNTDAWNLTDAEESKFKSDAVQIRKLCENLYEKFKSKFVVPDDSTFSDVFEDAVATFRKRTEYLSNEKICALTVEPSASRSSLPDEESEPQPGPRHKHESKHDSEATDVRSPKQKSKTHDPPREDMSIAFPFPAIKSEPVDVDALNDSNDSSGFFRADGKTLQVGKSEPKIEKYDENHENE